jgi:beta-barrel assembly-enhancing protease
MFSQLARKLTATTLAFILLGTSLAAAAPLQDQQPQPQPAAKTAQTDKDKKAKKDQKKDDQTTTDAAAATTAADNDPKRPLSTNEDPNMIGKRNINTGIWAKMAGSLEKEVALGRQLAAEIDREAKFVDDPVITEYVNRVGQNIVLHSDAKVPFTIKVIDSDEVNAFALPGGFFYVNKGLLLAADNEAEVAGVMAHEIAHVCARHAVENQAKGNAMQIGALIGSIFTGGIVGMVYQNLAGFGLLAAFMSFSRAAESEADKLGVQYMYAAGYDPNAMSTMFEKLAAQNKKKPGFIAKAFATHPQSVDRLQASRQLVARFPEREEYVLSTSEFQRVKARLFRLSNAKASTAGDLADENGQPKRPTLKRRQPTDDPTATPSTTGDGTQTQQKTEEPPKLKRRDQIPPPAQPQQTPPPGDNNQ